MENGYTLRYSVGANSPPYQSTPMIKNSSYNYIVDRSPHSTGSAERKTPVSGIHINGDIVDYCEISERLNGSGNFSQSLSPVSKLAEMDSSTIMRQRKELQLMITELKERDKELNELVQSHHKQLVSWEVDRERLSAISKQLEKVKTEYRKRHEQSKVLKDKLRKVDITLEAKNKEVISLKTALQQLQDRDNSSISHIEEQEQKIKSLQMSIEELSNSVGALRAHEQQLETLLRLRDNDLKDANNRVVELTEKLKISNNNANELKRLENDSKFELGKYRSEYEALKDEMEKLKVSYQDSVELENREEVSRLTQEVICLQKELMLANEREKRKDSLLELARSRQERTEVELSNLRLLYNTLQSDALMTKQQWCVDEDKMSVFSMSEYGDKDTGIPIVLNSTILLESPHSSLLMSSEGREMKKFSPISNHGSNASHSGFSPAHNEDAGTMSTGELQPTDISSNFDDHAQADGVEQIIESSPAIHLEKLLNQSKQMVQDLECSSTIVAKNILEIDDKPLCKDEKTPLSVKSHEEENITYSEEDKENKNVN